MMVVRPTPQSESAASCQIIPIGCRSGRTSAFSTCKFPMSAFVSFSRRTGRGSPVVSAASPAAKSMGGSDAQSRIVPCGPAGVSYALYRPHLQVKSCPRHGAGPNQPILDVGADRRPTGPPSDPFDYTTSRAQEVPLRLLAGYQGYLMTDDYAGYNGIAAVEGVSVWMLGPCSTQVH